MKHGILRSDPSKKLNKSRYRENTLVLILFNLNLLSKLYIVHISDFLLSVDFSEFFNIILLNLFNRPWIILMNYKVQN